MKATVLGILAFACLFLFAWAAPEARAESKTGKEIFVDRKCTKCHSIESEDIFKKKKKGAADEAKEEAGGFDDDFGDAQQKTEPPDLSDSGNKRDSEWMTQFLKKKIRTKEGKKHKMRFKGSDEELQILIEFLVGLKKDAPAEAGAE
jgi:cytochrome c2